MSRGGAAHRHHAGSAVLIGIGCVCMAVAAVLLLGRFAVAQEKQAESARTCEAVLAAWSESVPAATVNATAEAPNAVREGGARDETVSLPALHVQGIDIVGRLTCDDIGLDVPVAANGADAAVVPACEPKADGNASKTVVHGAAYEGAGAFERIGELEPGARFAFQRADGSVWNGSVVANGTTGEQFTDHFDLLVYYVDDRGQRVWAGCSAVS